MAGRCDEAGRRSDLGREARGEQSWTRVSRVESLLEPCLAGARWRTRGVGDEDKGEHEQRRVSLARRPRRPSSPSFLSTAPACRRACTELRGPPRATTVGGRLSVRDGYGQEAASVESSPTPSRRGGGQTVLIDRGRSRRPRSPGLRPSPLLLLPRPLILSSSLPAGQVVQRFFAHLQDQVPTHLHSLQPPHASLALFVALHPLSFNTDLTMLTTTTSLALLAVAGTAANAAGIVDNLQLFSKLTVSLSCPLNRARGRTTTPPRPRPLRAAGACSRGGSASLSTLQMDSSALGEAEEHPVGASGRAQGGGVGGRRSRSAAPNNNEAVLRRRAFKHLVLTRLLPHRAEPRRYELLGRVQGPERRDR